MIKADADKLAKISQEEYDSFNTRWTLPQNAFFGRYDYVKVDYHHAVYEVKRMVKDILEADLPENDLNELVAEIIYCEHQQVMKIFDSNIWAQQADNMLRSTLGILAATCKGSYIEIFGYYSKVQAQSKPGVINDEAQKIKDRAILSKWLALHFIAEFN